MFPNCEIMEPIEFYDSLKMVRQYMETSVTTCENSNSFFITHTINPPVKQFQIGFFIKGGIVHGIIRG